jgi:hypothetical protein
VNAAQRLVGLYPDPFREKWGSDLEIEIRATGWRSWPNLVMGIIDMWLHPAIWPADSRAQRHHRAATMAITVSAACWFLTHAVTELDTPLSTGVARAWPMTACTVLMHLGLVLVAPLPRLTRTAATTVLRHTASRFAVPAILGAGVVTWVHTGLYAAAPALLRPVGLACWWTALALGAIQSCRITADVGAGVAVPPRPGRLRLGLWTLAIAGTAPGPILLSASVTGEHLDLLSAASGAGLLLLTSAFAGTLRDIRHLPPAD